MKYLSRNLKYWVIRKNIDGYQYKTYYKKTVNSGIHPIANIRTNGKIHLETLVI